MAFLNKNNIILGNVYERNYWGHENPWFQGDPGYPAFVSFKGYKSKGAASEVRTVLTSASGFDKDYKIWGGSLYEKCSQSDYNRISNKSSSSYDNIITNLNIKVRWDDKDWIGAAYGKNEVLLNTLTYHRNYLSKYTKNLFFAADYDSFFVNAFDSSDSNFDLKFVEVANKFVDPSSTTVNKIINFDPEYDQKPETPNFDYGKYYAVIPKVIEDNKDISIHVEQIFIPLKTTEYNLDIPYGYSPLSKNNCHEGDPVWGGKWPKTTFKIEGGIGTIYNVDLEFYNFWFKVDKKILSAPTNLKSDNFGNYTWDPVPNAEGSYNMDTGSIGKKYVIYYWRIGESASQWKEVRTDATSFKMPNDYFFVPHHISVNPSDGHILHLENTETNNNSDSVETFYNYYAYTYDSSSISKVEQTGHAIEIKDVEVNVDINKVSLTWGYDFNKYPNLNINFKIGVYTNYDTSSNYAEYDIGSATSYSAKFPVGNHKFVIKAYITNYPDSLSSGTTVFATTKRLNAPYSLEFTLNTVDDGSFSWTSDVLDDARVIYRTFLNDNPYNETNDNTTNIYDLNQGKNSLSVQQVLIEDETYNSDKALLEITTDKLSAPYNLKFTRQSVNSGKLSWSSANGNIANSDFTVFIDGTALKDKTKDTSISLLNLAQGTRKFEVKQNYNDNHNYDSINSTPLEYDMTKITKPTISIKENYSDVKYTDPNTGEIVYVKDEQGNNIQGISSVNVNWDSTDTAKFSGIEFILYDRWNAEISEYQSSAKTLELSTQPTYKGVGVHNLYVKAIFSSDESYNSELSDETQYEINTLAQPTLTWANDLSSWNGKRIYESQITWLPVTTGSATGEHADYYLIKVIADEQAQGNAVTLLQPADLSKRLATFIPDPDPFTSDIKGLISSDPAKTTDYKINVYAMSFNEFYVGGSKPATEDYKIIRLNKPVNVQFDADTLTLSWNAVTDATIYYIYDNKNKIVETSETSYKFDHLEDVLHIFQISAMKITTEEA